MCDSLLVLMSIQCSWNGSASGVLFGPGVLAVCGVWLADLERRPNKEEWLCCLRTALVY